MKYLKPNKTHKENAKLAKSGAKPVVLVHNQKPLDDVRLEKRENMWITILNNQGKGLPSTDVEITLWLKLMEAENASAAV